MMKFNLRLHFLGLALVVSGLLHVPPAHAEPDPLSKIKAAYLYNILKFVTWPTDAYADPEAPLVVSVIGRGPFADALQEMDGRTANQRRILVRRTGPGLQPTTEHVLVLADDRHQLRDLPPERLGGSVVTVAQRWNFIEEGGVVNFLVKDQRLRFEINLASARQHNLTVSSRLLGMAERVLQ